MVPPPAEQVIKCSHTTQITGGAILPTCSPPINKILNYLSSFLYGWQLDDTLVDCMYSTVYLKIWPDDPLQVGHPESLGPSAT
jgi:hypothetical protein